MAHIHYRRLIQSQKKYLVQDVKAIIECFSRALFVSEEVCEHRSYQLGQARSTSRVDGHTINAQQQFSFQDLGTPQHPRPESQNH